MTRSYGVTDLLIPAREHPYVRNGLPTTQPVGSSLMSLPSDWRTRDSIGNGYTNDGIDPYRSRLRIDPPGLSATELLPPYDYDSLMDMITSTIDPQSWDGVGGPGSIREFDSLVVISQTYENHAQVEAMLKGIRAKKRAVPTLVVDARWMLLDSDLLGQLLPGDGADAGPAARIAVDPEKLDKLARKVPGFRGRIACVSGQHVHLAAGDRRTVAVSAIPVVGSGIGYQPVITIPNVGVLLEVRPLIVPGTKTVRLCVQSTVTQWRKPDPPLQIGGHFPPSEATEPSGETIQQPGGTASISVDRANMPTQQFAATMHVPLGKPVLLGGLTLSPTEEADGGDASKERAQLYLIVRTSLVAGRR